MRTSINKYCLLFLGFLIYMATAQEWPQDYFEARVYSNAQYDHDLPYRLFIPDEYDAQKSYPLVTFLSGVGERGTDNLLQLTANEGATVWAKPENQAVNACFVLAPQCPVEDSWYDFASEEPSVSSQMTLDIIDSLIYEFSIDTNRLYLTGLSMGGYGTFDVITKNPTRFAAAVPICGGGDIAQAETIKDIPIWIFHSDDDPTVPVENSRTMYQALLEAGSTSCLYTEYTGYGHASWVPAYAEPDLQKWVFAQKKGYTASTPLPVDNFTGESVDKWQINLSWQAAESATYPETGAWYYIIYRNDQKIDTTRALFFEDNELAESTEYTYEVRAVNYYLKESQDNTPLAITTLTDLEQPVVLRSRVVDQVNDSAVVRIKFNEPMDENSAVMLDNYQISPAAEIYGARLSQDMKSVLLSITPIEQGIDYVLTLNNLKDRALAQNTIAANSIATFRRGEWLICDVGPTKVTSNFSQQGEDFVVLSNGYDIGDTSDACTFIHKNGEGNLSLFAKITDFTAAETGAKAGVMVRESIEASSPFIALVVSHAGELLMVRRSKEGSNASVTSLTEAIDMPVYVKIERNDGKFYLFQSEDGLDWGDALRSIIVRMNDRIKMGLCLSAYSDSAASASFTEVQTNYSPLTIDGRQIQSMADKFQLISAYPNPFNPAITISYTISPLLLNTTAKVQMDVYNILGQRIYHSEQPAQETGHFIWNGTNQNYIQQASGIYLVQLTYGMHKEVRKITLVR